MCPVSATGSIAACHERLIGFYVSRSRCSRLPPNQRAHSDPNDILSYTIPPEFVDTYLDSRICPAIINVAPVANLFGLGEYADPLTAHVDYDDDERVIAMIAQGFGPGRTAPVVEERCSFTRTINQFGNATPGS